MGFEESRAQRGFLFVKKENLGWQKNRYKFPVVTNNIFKSSLYKKGEYIYESHRYSEKNR